MLHQSYQPITSTILIADAQAVNRELLQELLTAPGCKVITVPDVTARVLQIVVVYDDLTTVRSHKHAFSITDALQTMKQGVAQNWWDPHIFDQFERLVRSCTAALLSHGVAAGM
jgi:CheY-like chemotaxis protein